MGNARSFRRERGRGQIENGHIAEASCDKVRCAAPNINDHGSFSRSHKLQQIKGKAGSLLRPV